MFLTKQSIFSGKLRFIVLVTGLTGVLFGSNIMAEDSVPAGSEYVLNSILEIEPPMSERACFDSITTANERLITACIGTDNSGAVDFQIEANIFEKNSSGEFQQIYKVQLPTVSTNRSAIEQNITVRADGPWLVVAVPEERGETFPNNGAVYIYKQAPDGIAYEFVEKLLPQTEPYMPSDGFGVAMDIEEDRLIVKSAVENATSGFLYNYQFDGASWILQNKTPLDNGYGEVYLKQNLVLDGETIYVSTNKMNQFSGTGEVHIFEYDAMMTEWMFKQALAAEYNSAPGYFGQEFVVEGDTIIALVSDAPARNQTSVSVRGELAVFSRPDQYAPWGQAGEILSPGIYSDTEGFGLSLLLKGDELLVGAPKANDFTGTVYQFAFNELFGTWDFIGEVLPVEVMQKSGFGDNILAINNTSIIVGAPGKELWQQGEYYPGYGYVLSTEIQVQDTDGDGMPDQWEIDNGLDPSYPDADYDFDGDSLTNLEEYQAGSNPQNPDTDGDTMADGWEVQNGLNPLEDDAQLDSDEDGVSNLDEFLVGTDPNDAGDRPQIQFKALSLNGLDSYESNVCDISSNGEYILGINQAYPSYGDIVVWHNGSLKQNLNVSGECSAVSDDGKILMQDHYLSPVIVEMGYELDGKVFMEMVEEYEMTTFPIGFRTDMLSEISGDGTVMTGMLNYKAAIWNGEEIVEILADTERDYYFNVATGVSVNGEIVVGMADYDNGEQTVSMPFRWTKDLGVEQLECEAGKNCEVRGVSDDGSVVIGALFSESGSYGVWWNRYGEMQLLLNSPEIAEYYPLAVNKDGSYILGSTNPDGNGEAFIWEREINKVSLLKDWLIEREQLVGSPIGDFYSWQLTSVAGISADGNVITGNGVDPSGNNRSWIVSINLNDDDSDGIDDIWELEHGLSPEDAQDADMDFDDDGLTNKQEYLLHTNLHDLDTDKDGIDDGVEVEFGLDPLVDDAEMDLDEDGINNLDEIQVGTDPFDAADFPQILFKKLTIKDLVSGEYETCDISPNGKIIYGKTISGYGQGIIWENGKFKGEAPSSSTCGLVSDNGKLATAQEIFVPIVYPDGVSWYEWTPYPDGFKLDFYEEFSGDISGDGTVVAGSYNDQAAIWDGTEVTELLADTGREYMLNVATGVSYDGKVVVGMAEYNEEGQIISMPYKWVEGQGIEVLECQVGDHCHVDGISDDGSTIIGNVYSYGKSYSAWWDVNGYLHTIEISGNDRELIPNAVSNNGAYIVGEVRDGPYPVEAFIWEKKTDNAMPFQSWLMEQEYQLDTPVGDFHSWQLTSVTGISADGTVISGNGTDPQGNKSAWIVSIKLKDFDADGMPDKWEMENGLDPYYPDADIDFDFDGLTNLEEYVVGTNPQKNDTDYDGMPDDWEVKNGLNPTDDGNAFADGDKDGLVNIDEYHYGTSPVVADTDGDGVNDGLEIQYGFDPLSDQSPNDSGDMDSDGLGDKSEFVLGADPKNPDTDGDGIYDGWEAQNGLNPTNSIDAVADEDLDGLTNLQEFQNGTNPKASDTDGDGIPDGAEIGFGLNPLDPADAALDADGDGMSNLDEYTKGFDPKSANQSPEVSITLPSENIQVIEGASVELNAEANDAEDGVLTSVVAWSSDLDGELGDGASQTTALSVGVHNITATVADSFGSESSDQVVVEVLANQVPVVTITQPVTSTVVTEGTLVDFAANASDSEDGDLSAAIEWSSSNDGTLGTGTSLSISLSVGTHLISAAVEDSHGEITTSEVTLIVEPIVATEFPAGDNIPDLWATNALKGWSVDSSNAIEGSKSLKSGTVEHRQTSSLFVTGNFTAGEISFQCKTSSETRYDYLRFYIDGVKKGEWSGEVDWQSVSYSLTAGEHTLTWAYEKDGSVSKGSDAAWVDAVSIPDFSEVEITEEFLADGQMPSGFETEGTAWVVDATSETIDGKYALRSGDITHRETSSIEITREVAAGDMSFLFRVSTERYYDFLHFYIDGQEMDKWAGDFPWQEKTYSLSAGTHTFKWVYKKDSSVNKLDDAVWIDKVVFPE